MRSDLAKVEGVSNIHTDIKARTCRFQLANKDLFIELAKCFGKGAGFGLGLALLSPIFFPLLGFGDAKYRGPQKS